MTHTRKKAYKCLLWLIRYLHLQSKCIKEMRSVDRIQSGHMYSHYGRIIVAEAKQKGCEQCELNAQCLPCGNCEQQFVFTILETPHQNSTSQKMYQRITAQRLGYNMK